MYLRPVPGDQQVRGCSLVLREQNGREKVETPREAGLLAQHSEMRES